jgi:hypothetical protein
MTWCTPFQKSNDRHVELFREFVKMREAAAGKENSSRHPV